LSFIHDDTIINPVKEAIGLCFFSRLLHTQRVIRSSPNNKVLRVRAGIKYMSIIIVSLCAWAVAQLLKGILVVVQKRELDFQAFVAMGGMPSSHSAIVCALATSVGMVEGLGSSAFGISVVLAMIVMYDAAGVRRSVGKQAVVLNRIVKELKERRPIANLEHNLLELVGHTAFQVTIGAFIGVAASLIWFLWLS
jgi:uncharacterized protein